MRRSGGVSRKVTPQALDSLLRWSETYIDDRALAEEDENSSSAYHPSPFPFDADLNNKLVIHHGDVCSLPVDAIVNPSNERLTDRAGATKRLYAVAGAAFEAESNQQSLDSLGSTALIQISPGSPLPAKHVIHTVGPRYQDKYITAAENALHKCYRNTMALAREQLFETVAFIPLHKQRVRDPTQYPRDSGAHTALRTIRRCLEKWGDTIHTVVLAADSIEDFEAFRAVAPLYFPRNRAEEANALFLLPDNTGNANGELILKERMIRIEGSVPDPLLDEMEAVETELTTLRTRETAEQKRGDYEAAIATRDQVGELTSRLHALRSQYNAKQALARAGSSNIYTAGMTSQKSKQISRELALGGFANVRGDPDERHKDNGAKRSNGPKSLGRGYCGKLIKEGVLYKQGLRSKVWSRRSIQLTSEALVYSHAVRSHGGFIAVSAITNCRGIDIDGEPLGFQVIEDDSRVHVYRCHSQLVRDAWLSAFETARMVTKKDSSGVRRRGADDDEEDDDEDLEDYGDGTSIPQRKGIILEGLLEKQGLRSHLWMKRHASLAGDAMSYSHGFFGSKKTARILVNDMVRTMQLQDGEPVSGTNHDTVEFGIILRGGRTDLWRARTAHEARRWVNAINDLLADEKKRRAKKAAHEQKVAREKPTAAPSELVVRERTGGKVRAPVVPQDPAVGIRLLSVQVFNKKTFSFLCTDSANDHQWTVERSFKCIDQLYHALVDWKYTGAEELSKPENSTASVDRFMRELLRSGCKMAAVLLSEVDAQDKEADKAQWRVVAKRSQLIFRRVEFFDGASATPLFRFQGSASLFGSALQRTTPGNALEVEVPKSALEGSIRVAVKALLGVPFHSLRIFWDISSTVSGIIGTGSKHFGQQPNSPSVDVEFVVPIKTNKPRVRLRFWAMDEAAPGGGVHYFDPVSFFGWHLHTGKAYKLERNATTGKLRRRGHQDSSEEEEDIATDSDDDDEANE